MSRTPSRVADAVQNWWRGWIEIHARTRAIHVAWLEAERRDETPEGRDFRWKSARNDNAVLIDKVTQRERLVARRHKDGWIERHRHHQRGIHIRVGTRKGSVVDFLVRIVGSATGKDERRDAVADGCGRIADRGRHQW